MTNDILLGYAGENPQALLLKRANRHGLVAGATGTGKTVTLATMATRFAAAGVPVFVADIKGDLAPIAKLTPTKFWDLSGQHGEPIKVAVQDLGPALFSHLLELNDVQDGVVCIMFAYAKEKGITIRTLADVRKVLNAIQNNQEVSMAYGNVDTRSAAAIKRSLLRLEQSGAGEFFDETTFYLNDLIRHQGTQGIINILRAEQLINDPTLYSTFLFWLLNELFKKLPEVGDTEKPKLVFFFDEAHLLFADANKSFTNTIERVVRLIRSKGVGVYFVTQSPADIPDNVLSQLGNRVQHALRAYTANEQRGLKAAAMSFRANDEFDTATAIQELGVGEALVSVLDADGIPSKVQRTRIAAIAFPKNGAVIEVAKAQPKVVRRNPETLAEPSAEVIDSPLVLPIVRKRVRKASRLWVFPFMATATTAFWFVSAFLPSVDTLSTMLNNAASVIS